MILSKKKGYIGAQEKLRVALGENGNLVLAILSLKYLEHPKC